jgi:hypothetical protein
MSIIVYSMDELNRLIREGGLPIEAPVLNNATGSLNGVTGSVSGLTGSVSGLTGSLNGITGSLNGVTGSLAAAIAFATGGTATHLPMGVINSQYATIGNVGAGEDDLLTYTLPANTLDADGKAVRIRIWGTGNSIDNVTLKVHFGSFSLTITSGSAIGIWRSELIIIRTGAAGQHWDGFHMKGASPAIETVFLSTSETLSNSIVIKCTGENTSDASSSAITQKGMVIELLN